MENKTFPALIRRIGVYGHFFSISAISSCLTVLGLIINCIITNEKQTAIGFFFFFWLDLNPSVKFVKRGMQSVVFVQSVFGHGHYISS